MVSSLYCSVTKLSNMKQPLDCAQILLVRSLDRTQWEQLVSAQLGLSRLGVAQCPRISKGPRGPLLAKVLDHLP